ncbi:hypothetical protein GCM10023347_09580 [Streptomyces chumphonensis]
MLTECATSWPADHGQREYGCPDTAATALRLSAPPVIGPDRLALRVGAFGVVEGLAGLLGVAAPGDDVVAGRHQALP